jgi:hypothetical protein
MRRGLAGADTGGGVVVEETLKAVGFYIPVVLIAGVYLALVRGR